MRAFSQLAAGVAMAGLTASACLTADLALDSRPAWAQAQPPRVGSSQFRPAIKPKPPAKRNPTVANSTAAPTRPSFTAEDQAAAVVPGIPDARAWGDSEDDFARLLPSASGPWLAMSGGGSDGAYAAGLLTGLTQAGNRPDFAVVTGASIGALISPFAFLGPRYDDELHELFTTITAGDIFEDRSTGESLTDSWPLKRTIEQHATMKLMNDVAAEYRRGRRLLTVTTNLDSGRRVIWNMGAIAARGDEQALQLFRSVLLASASIPGISRQS